MLLPSYKRWPRKTDLYLRIRSATPRRSRTEVRAAIVPHSYGSLTFLRTAGFDTVCPCAIYLTYAGTDARPDAVGR